MTKTSTLAEYRNLYRNRHGIACPLSDAEIVTALAAASTTLDEYPLKLAVLTEMEATVASEFPEVNQDNYLHGGTMEVNALAQTNGGATTAELTIVAATGGNPAYSYQLQQAEDVEGVAGEYADVQEAQADTTPWAVTGLSVAVWWRVKVTDQNGEVLYSNEVRWLLAPQDLALDNATAEGFDVNFGAATLGVSPYSYQLQLAPDDSGPGTYEDSGAAQATDAEIVKTGLTAETTYWARVKVTDAAGSISYSNEDSQATSA